MKTKMTAFTLIELLVVIAIIAILAGMLLPSLHKAKGVSTGVKCSGNLREISRYYTLYSSDYNEYLPNPYTLGYTDTNNFFWEKFAGIYKFPFGKNKPDALLRCPNYPDKGYTGGQFATSYGGNTAAFVGARSPAFFAAKHRTLRQFRHLSKSVFIGDNYNHHRVDWTEQVAPLPESHTKCAIAFRHLGRGNFAFGDGHTESRLPKNVPCLQGYPNMTSDANQLKLARSFFWYGNPDEVAAFNGM